MGVLLKPHVRQDGSVCIKRSNFSKWTRLCFSLSLLSSSPKIPSASSKDAQSPTENNSRRLPLLPLLVLPSWVLSAFSSNSSTFPSITSLWDHKDHCLISRM